MSKNVDLWEVAASIFGHPDTQKKVYWEEIDKTLRREYGEDAIFFESDKDRSIYVVSQKGDRAFEVLNVYIGTYRDPYGDTESEVVDEKLSTYKTPEGAVRAAYKASRQPSEMLQRWEHDYDVGRAYD